MKYIRFLMTKVSVSDPSHLRPPLAGLGLSHDLVRVNVSGLVKPVGKDHADQGPQFPSTAGMIEGIN